MFSLGRLCARLGYHQLFSLRLPTASRQRRGRTRVLSHPREPSGARTLPHGRLRARPERIELPTLGNFRIWKYIFLRRQRKDNCRSPVVLTAGPRADLNRHRWNAPTTTYTGRSKTAATRPALATPRDHVICVLGVALAKCAWGFVIRKSYPGLMLVYVGLCRFMLVYVGLCWFMLVYVGLCGFMRIYVGVCVFMLAYVSSCWFMESYQGGQVNLI